MTAADTIREFIIKELHWDGDRRVLTPEYQLIEHHVLDSLGLFTLVSFVEQQFGIVIADEELLPENFGTLEAITRLIEGKRALSTGAIPDGRA